MDNTRIRWLIRPGPRHHIVESVLRAPIGHVVDIRPETRSDEQNRLMWPLLTDVSKQVIWHGRSLPPLEWKNGFMIGLGHEDFVPGIVPGTIWPLGLSSSILSKSKFSFLIELIYAFGAEHQVQFRDPPSKDAPNPLESD